MIDTGPIKKAIKDTEAEMKVLTPTPLVGTAVNWYRGADKEKSYAAVVTLIQGVGKVKLSVFEPDKFVTHKTGVLHITDPTHEKRANRTSKDCGAWDYLEGVEPDETHFELHLALLEKRKGGFVVQLKEAEKRNAEELKPQKA